jgi:tRNA(Arg) A34 adenosine deaminase TadA
MRGDHDFLQQAISLAAANVAEGGRPFGAVLVCEGQVVTEASNQMHLRQDPTAHAELLCIRQASELLASNRLDGCVIYASGQPCPMCLSAMHLCGISRVVFAAANADGEPFGLSTAGVYQQLGLPLAQQSLCIEHVAHNAMPALYQRWHALHA